MRAWLTRPLWGRPVWAWLACAVAVAVAWYALRSGWVAALVAWVFSLLRPTARVAVSPADAPDPAPAALDAHSAALETDRALAHVEAEATARGEAGRLAAESDPIEVVRARIEARARRACEERGVEYTGPPVGGMTTKGKP